jgi:hypothetical protein
VGGLAQRANDVEDCVASIQGIEQVSGLAYGLDDDIDGAALRIGILNRQWYALALLVDAHDDELPGPLFPGDARRFDNETFNSGRQKLRVYDFEHNPPMATAHCPEGK